MPYPNHQGASPPSSGYCLILSRSRQNTPSFSNSVTDFPSQDINKKPKISRVVEPGRDADNRSEQSCCTWSSDDTENPKTPWTKCVDGDTLRIISGADNFYPDATVSAQRDGPESGFSIVAGSISSFATHSVLNDFVDHELSYQ
jgi:hypothetical protein